MPVPATPRASTRTRIAPKTEPRPAGRVTRLRTAKEGTSSPGAALGTRTPGATGLLKEGLRKVSDKLKEKESKSKLATAAATESTHHQESLQAFLRIRPPPQDADALRAANPYLEPQDDKNALMRPPPDPSRPHVSKPSQVYSFDRVYGPQTQQHAFFHTTTLPLVEKLLKGENGLMFAYGVSNSGKSYTIQGGNNYSVEDRGVLPRAIDVVFNSISGLESKANLKCQGLADVVLTNEDEGRSLSSLVAEPEARIDDTIKVDRNFSYAVFVSYAEVYNEKIFDLLESVIPSTRPTVLMPRTMSMGISSAFGSTMSLAAMANGGAGVLKRRALVLKNDPEGSGKYISGLHEIRVRTREEALAVFRSGQRARQVFGTMSNRESSRSHGIFTIKVVRVHNGAPEDPDSAQVARLAIVDLAGSERARNTATTGDRLKEAGNINKSLMVLGQCLEVLRANQQKMASPHLPGIKKRLAVVPFRHSKLTEIFQNFFVGDGRAVMIIHVNPYDTGYDENSHVMRFSAIAREIQTTAANKSTTSTLKRQISTQFSAFKDTLRGGQRIKVSVPVMQKPAPTPATPRAPSRPASRPPSRPGSAAAMRPPATPSAAIKSAHRVMPATPQEPVTFEVVEEEIEVVEEDAEEEEEDDRDVLVDYLFEQLNDLKTQLYESEMRNASIEVEIRSEVARDMQETIQRIHTEFNARLQKAMAFGEEKADLKLDILQRTMAADEFDSSFDQSFASALDEGDSIDGDRSGLSDPFAMPEAESDSEAEAEVALIVSGATDNEHVDEEDDDSADSESEGSEEGESLVHSDEDEEESEKEESEDDEDEVVAPVEVLVEAVQVATVPAEASQAQTTVTDELVAEPLPVKEVAVSDESDEEVETVEARDSDEEVEEEEEGEEDDEDEDEGDEEDEESDEGEEEDASDGDFSFDATASTIESIPSPPRRTTLRRLTRSPTKKATPSKLPKPTPKTPVRIKSSLPTLNSPVLGTPLGESLRQATNADDDDEYVRPPTVKKKRTLGKRVATEDEIESAADRPIGGAEVRRMMRGV